jgi:hypothetical protein
VEFAEDKAIKKGQTDGTVGTGHDQRVAAAAARYGTDQNRPVEKPFPTDLDPNFLQALIYLARLAADQMGPP